MEDLDAYHERREFTVKKINSKDVTAQALKNTNIDEVEDMIMVQEEILSTDLTLQNITGLLHLY